MAEADDAIVAALARALCDDLPADHAGLAALRAHLETLAAAAPGDDAIDTISPPQLAAFEQRLGTALIVLGVGELGQRLLIPWEENIARAQVTRLLLDNDRAAAAALCSRWRDDIDAWSRRQESLADEWALLMTIAEGRNTLDADCLRRLKSAGRDAAFAALLRGIKAERLEVAMPAAPPVTAAAVAEPPVFEHATSPAPDAGMSIAETAQPVTRLEPRADLAPAWNHLVAHGVIDATTVSAMLRHPRRVRLFAREVGAWAQASGGTVRAQAVDGRRVWRLERAP